MNTLTFEPLLAAWDWGYLLAIIVGVIILATLLPLFLSRRPRKGARNEKSTTSEPQSEFLSDQPNRPPKPKEPEP